MQSVAAEHKSLMLESMVTSKVGIQRLAVGFLQGVILYFLYHASKMNAWPSTESFLFAPLLLVSLLCPLWTSRTRAAQESNAWCRCRRYS